MSAKLEMRIKQGIIGSEVEVRRYELYAAMIKFNKVFHNKTIEDANDAGDLPSETHQYLEPEFAKPEVYDAFRTACIIYKSVRLKHKVERDIGKRLQARVAFFREAGSCPDGRSHRRNLLHDQFAADGGKLGAKNRHFKSAAFWSLPRRLINTKVGCMLNIDQFIHLGYEEQCRLLWL
ncbi:uncharacterized protein LOC119639848 [Glossina fuscipes]|uniref:Uncharacterized protein LOC119639848 n=1 Tax=Glossina fuscipes TaxID=7396 RepID=A0A9C6DYH2_9MUSC|nr:uncharacterized protein LOC119639848 [Glossina fuscipes]